MPSKIFRTVSSTVVLLKDSRLLEVRRGDLHGEYLTDKRTWASEAEWLAMIGESLLDEPELTDDQNLVQQLYNSEIYNPPIGRLFRDGKAKTELQRVKRRLKLKKEAQTYLLNLKPNSKNLYYIPEEIHRKAEQYYDRYNQYYSECNYKRSLEVCEEDIVNLEKDLFELSTKVEADRVLPRYYIAKKASYFIETEDGVIRPVYFYPQKALIGLISDEDLIKTGRSFKELGVNIVRWWHQDGNIRRLEF